MCATILGGLEFVKNLSNLSENCRFSIGKRFNRSLVRIGVWRGRAGFEIAPSKLQKEGENPGKGHFYFLRQTLVCTKPWFKRDLILQILDKFLFGYKKHAKKSSIKNFGAPKTPALQNSLCRPFSCILKGKEAPT